MVGAHGAVRDALKTTKSNAVIIGLPAIAMVKSESAVRRRDFLGASICVAALCRAKAAPVRRGSVAVTPRQ